MVQCEICGGTLLINAGGKTATCQQCGIHYTIERLRELAGNVSQPAAKQSAVVTPPVAAPQPKPAAQPSFKKTEAVAPTAAPQQTGIKPMQSAAAPKPAAQPGLKKTEAVAAVPQQTGIKPKQSATPPKPAAAPQANTSGNSYSGKEISQILNSGLLKMICAQQAMVLEDEVFRTSLRDDGGAEFAKMVVGNKGFHWVFYDKYENEVFTGSENLFSHYYERAKGPDAKTWGERLAQDNPPIHCIEYELTKPAVSAQICSYVAKVTGKYVYDATKVCLRFMK